MTGVGGEKKKKERKKERKNAHNGKGWSPSVRMHISVLCIQTAGNGRPTFWAREIKKREGEMRGRFTVMKQLLREGCDEWIACYVSYDFQIVVIRPYFSPRYLYS